MVLSVSETDLDSLGVRRCQVRELGRVGRLCGMLSRTVAHAMDWSPWFKLTQNGRDVRTKAMPGDPWH